MTVIHLSQKLGWLAATHEEGFLAVIQVLEATFLTEEDEKTIKKKLNEFLELDVQGRTFYLATQQFIGLNTDDEFQDDFHHEEEQSYVNSIHSQLLSQAVDFWHDYIIKNPDFPAMYAYLFLN